MNFIEILKSRETYPGYPGPNGRTKLSESCYESWAMYGRNTGFARRLYRHPEYLQAVENGTAIIDYNGNCNFHKVEFASSFTGEYVRDAAGRPLHPYAKQIFAAGLALEGPGAYPTYGPNFGVHAIILGLGNECKLKTIVINELTEGAIAFPSGDCASGECPARASFRIQYDQTNVNIQIKDVSSIDRIEEGIVADPRTTLNAWTETTVFCFTVLPGVIETYQPAVSKKGNAMIVLVDTDLHRNISDMHANYLRLAVDQFENNLGCNVLDDGSIDIRR